VLFIAITFSLLLGLVDLATGIELHFLLLYMMPIFLGSWFVSRDVGVGLAIFGSLIWFITDSLNGRAIPRRGSAIGTCSCALVCSSFLLSLKRP